MDDRAGGWPASRVVIARSSVTAGLAKANPIGDLAMTDATMVLRPVGKTPDTGLLGEMPWEPVAPRH